MSRRRAACTFDVAILARNCSTTTHQSHAKWYGGEGDIGIARRAKC